MSKIDLVEKEYLKEKPPEFRVGDEVRVDLKVREGEKTRTQVYAGTVIKRRGRGTGATFTVLKEVRGDVIEKVFPLHSPHVEKVTVTNKGNVKKAKLYHIRKKYLAKK